MVSGKALFFPPFVCISVYADIQQIRIDKILEQKVFVVSGIEPVAFSPASRANPQSLYYVLNEAEIRKNDKVCILCF